jgi:hypothetical protein
VWQLDHISKVTRLDSAGAQPSQLLSTSMHTSFKMKSKFAELVSKFKITNRRFTTIKFQNLTNMEFNVSETIIKLDRCLLFGEIELSSVLMMESLYMECTVSLISEVMSLPITERVESRS